MSELHSFRLIRFSEFKNDENEILSILPTSNLRLLSIPTLESILTQTSIVTYLTVSSCSLDQLICQLFKFTPLLKYLHVQTIYKSSQLIKNDESCQYYNAIHLKQIIINSFEYTFDEFEIFIKLIPNLKHLTISALDNIYMIDPYRWEDLIKTSLPHLKTFRFIFGLYCRGKVRNDVIDKFKQFQNDFWFKQHQWFNEYVLDKNSAVIYTLPYPSNTFRLKFSTEKYSNPLIRYMNPFDNVTDLTVCNGVVTEKYDYYFSNVTSLKSNI
jgi:hypothetical protein